MGTRVQVISDVVEVGVPILTGGPCRFRLGLGYSARGLGWTCQTTPSSREGSVSQTREREAVSTRGFGRFIPARFFSPHLRRLRELVWVGGCVTVPVAWAQVRAPWHHGGHGAVDVVGPVTPPGRASPVLSPAARVRAPAGSACPQGQRVYTDWRKRPLGAVFDHLCTLLRRCGQTWGRRSVHRSAKTASWRRFGAFVYTVATRGSCELRCELRRALCRVARVAQPLWCAGGAPLGGRLSLGRENRLYASAAASLPSSSRQQPMQTPEEPFVFSLKVEALMPPRGAYPPCAAQLCARPRGPSRG